MADIETIAVGTDHAGFPLKGEVVAQLERRGYGVLDLGTHSTEPVDYPDVAAAVGGAVQRGEVRRGIVLCGSGAGACIAANKITGVRAAVCHDTYSAHQVVEHDDANVLCLGARIVGASLAEEILDAWLDASFSGEERHQRRLDKVLALEASGTAARLPTH
jgi:RpiB/LacA/LacB family sugar-phosphate isomerase